MIQTQIQQEIIIQGPFKHSQPPPKQIYINSSSNGINQASINVQQLEINDIENSKQTSYINDLDNNENSLQNQNQEIQQRKTKKSLTDIDEEKQSQIKSISNTIPMNSTMKIKIINLRNGKSQNFSEVNESKDDAFAVMRLNKTKDTLYVKDLADTACIDNTKELIMMRSLNEKDFKNAKLNSISRDRSVRIKRSKSPLKATKINDSQNPSTKNDSSYNTYLNSNFSAAMIPYKKTMGQSNFCKTSESNNGQELNHKQLNEKCKDNNKEQLQKISKQESCEKNEEEIKQNNNELLQDDIFNINKTTKSNSRMSNQVMLSRIMSRNAGINGIERNNMINSLNQNVQQSDEEDDDSDVVQSFNTQNNPQQKEQTFNIQMKDLRFFQNSRNIIVVDLQNPRKIEQLCKEKTMKDWFLRRKSVANFGNLNQNAKSNLKQNEQNNNKEISVGQTNLDNQNTKLQPKEEEDERVCKICFEGEIKSVKDIDANKKKKRKSKVINIKQSPLLSPCLCQGSMKYIHEECLKEWIISKLCQQIRTNSQALSDLSQTQCEICKYTYRMEIMLGDKFLPSQAIRKGLKPIYFSLITFLITCMLFYLTYHFTYQSGDEDKMESGYSLGIGVCSGIIGCVFLCISIICLKECLYVKKIVTWVIYNSERQKKIESITTQIINRTYNGFRIQGIKPNEYENQDASRQNNLNLSQNLNQTIDQNNQTNSNILQNQYQQSDLNETIVDNSNYQPIEVQNQSVSISRMSPEQRFQQDNNNNNDNNNSQLFSLHN